jgi:hypothetical protein
MSRTTVEFWCRALQQPLLTIWPGAVISCSPRAWVEKVVLATLSNANVQYFYRDWYEPKDGYYELPSGPGFGYELDEGKIRGTSEL